MDTKLKIILICSTLFTTTVCLTQVLEKCFSKIPDESLDEFNKYSNQPLSKVSDKNVMCFIKCLNEGMGLMKNGKFITDSRMITDKNLEQIFNNPKFKDAIRMCSKVTGKDSCETSLRQTQCFSRAIVIKKPLNRTGTIGS